MALDSCIFRRPGCCPSICNCVVVLQGPGLHLEYSTSTVAESYMEVILHPRSRPGRACAKLSQSRCRPIYNYGTYICNWIMVPEPTTIGSLAVLRTGTYVGVLIQIEY